MLISLLLFVWIEMEFRDGILTSFVERLCSILESSVGIFRFAERFIKIVNFMKQCNSSKIVDSKGKWVTSCVCFFNNSRLIDFLAIEYILRNWIELLNTSFSEEARNCLEACKNLFTKHKILARTIYCRKL